MSRFFRSDAHLPWPWRLTYFLLGLAILGATYVATESDGAQFIAILVLVFVIHPVLANLGGVPWPPYLNTKPPRHFPNDVLVWSMAFACVWGAIVILFRPDLGVGEWFWWWVVIWPWIEVFLFLAERRFQRDGGVETWKPAHPIRDGAFAGGVTAPLVTGVMLLQDYSVGEAVATGAVCGVILFLFGVGFTWWAVRDAQRSS